MHTTSSWLHLLEIPGNVGKKLWFVFVEDMDQVLEQALTQGVVLPVLVPPPREVQRQQPSIQA